MNLYVFIKIFIPAPHVLGVITLRILRWKLYSSLSVKIRICHNSLLRFWQNQQSKILTKSSLRLPRYSLILDGLGCA